MRTSIFMSALALAFSLPLSAHAAVYINEIAWMGTMISASDEWIELYNDGTEEVPLAGWKLVAEDGAPSISLSGTISAGGYYLLERTDDTTVPDIAADKLYTGDIANAGETLRLLGASDVTVDTASGGTDWEALGGNNATKDTPQRQIDGTWLTGISTPRAANTTIASAPPDGDVAGTSTAKATTKKSVFTGGYKQVVFAYAGEDTTGIVDAALRFEGYAVTDKNEPIRHATYHWSFGDGGQDEGKETIHAYEEPGTYTVVLRVFSGMQKWKDALTVTVLPAKAAIIGRKAGERGYVEVRNDARTELDLSGWRLTVLYARKHPRDRTFIIPESTVIAPQTSVRFPARVTGFSFADEDAVVLQYPSGARVRSSVQE